MLLCLSIGLPLNHRTLSQPNQALCIGHANTLDALRADHAAALHAFHIKQANIAETTHNAHETAMQVRVGEIGRQIIAMYFKQFMISRSGFFLSINE
jgi:hypothetical protein